MHHTQKLLHIKSNIMKPTTADPMDDIGWKCLWFGMLPYTWELEQEKHYRKLRKDKKTHNGRTWTAHLIKYTWEQLQK